jgi:hypothetical protein
MYYFRPSKKLLTFSEINMENVNTENDAVGVKQLVLAVLAIVVILALWSFLTSVHI